MGQAIAKAQKVPTGGGQGPFLAGKAITTVVSILYIMIEVLLVFIALDSPIIIENYFYPGLEPGIRFQTFGYMHTLEVIFLIFTGLSPIILSGGFMTQDWMWNTILGVIQGIVALASLTIWLISWVTFFIWRNEFDRPYWNPANSKYFCCAEKAYLTNIDETHCPNFNQTCVGIGALYSAGTLPLELNIWFMIRLLILPAITAGAVANIIGLVIATGREALVGAATVGEDILQLIGDEVDGTGVNKSKHTGVSSSGSTGLGILNVLEPTINPQQNFEQFTGSGKKRKVY